MPRRAPAILILLLSAALLPALGYSPEATSPEATSPEAGSPAAGSPKAPPQKAFDDRAASRLLMQLGEALQGHSQKQFLAVFDLASMKNGSLFQQQIASFFSGTESIRVHLNLVEVAAEGERPALAVDAEMELQPGNGGPALRRNERLNFVAAGSGGSWKFVDLQPRGFFSLP